MVASLQVEARIYMACRWKNCTCCYTVQKQCTTFILFNNIFYVVMQVRTLRAETGSHVFCWEHMVKWEHLCETATGHHIQLKFDKRVQTTMRSYRKRTHEGRFQQEVQVTRDETRGIRTASSTSVWSVYIQTPSWSPHSVVAAEGRRRLHGCRKHRPRRWRTRCYPYLQHICAAWWRCWRL